MEYSDDLTKKKTRTEKYENENTEFIDTDLYSFIKRLRGTILCNLSTKGYPRGRRG